MKQTALITGASGGIGLVFAQKLAKEGYDLVLVARSEKTLQTLAEQLRSQHGIRVTVLAKDLSHLEAPNEIYEALQGAGTAVDVLINNAGFASYGLFHELDRAKELEMVQLNITNLVALTHLFVQDMVRRGYGRVLNVASTAAFQPGPLMATYYASKAFVLHFSEAIANELQGTGVTVTALCPGPTASGFQERAAMQESKLVQGGLMSAEAVVEQGYQALLSGKVVEIPGLSNKVGAWSARLVPRQTAVGIVRRMQERQGH